MSIGRLPDPLAISTYRPWFTEDDMSPNS